MRCTSSAPSLEANFANLRSGAAVVDPQLHVVVRNLRTEDLPSEEPRSGICYFMPRLPHGGRCDERTSEQHLVGAPAAGYRGLDVREEAGA